MAADPLTTGAAHIEVEVSTRRPRKKRSFGSAISAGYTTMAAKKDFPLFERFSANEFMTIAGPPTSALKNGLITQRSGVQIPPGKSHFLND